VSSNNLISTDAPVIIIDAGHGGEDGGAVVQNNNFEKDINLVIAQKTNDILSLFGFNTKMVRNTDVLIYDSDSKTQRQKKNSDLRNRLKLMENFNNCLYISIHQNKYDDNRIWGAQTFYSPNDEESPILAEFIQSSIVTLIQPNNKRAITKTGTNVFVIYNATKPAIMVECGFMSNNDELLKLKDDKYQNQMSFSISNGILNYYISEVQNGSEV
jgi:N-acetylmuramoyl-L-alanine amidase